MRREFRTIATPAAPACDVEGVPRSVRVVVDGGDPGHPPPPGVRFERPQAREARLAPGRAPGGDIGVDFEIADSRVWPVLQDEHQLDPSEIHGSFLALGRHRGKL